ncbi:MAG TPA: methyltransferase domain-containing protein [Rhodopila sp.]|jgi:SAM-dependent methyltransferase
MRQTQTGAGCHVRPSSDCPAGSRQQRPVREDCAAALDRTAERYRYCGRGAHFYVRSKLRRDPVHRDVLRLAAENHFGNVLDIGCGRGQLGIALLEAGLATSVTGVDCQTAHLAQAERAAAALAFRTKPLDLASGFDVPAADTILAIDVLYQLDDDSQHRLLQAIAQAARHRVVLRLLDPGLGPRSALTVGMERLWRRISPNAGRWVNPWPVKRIAAIFEAAGYDVTVAPCWQDTPFANVLLNGRRSRPDVTSED